MKRHNARAIAAAVAIAAAAAASAEGKKKTDSKQTVNSSTLYVDVVKNMSKPEALSPVTPPSPKFTILREDFPALPGTQDAESRDTNIGVPDDWTAMISEDDDNDNLDDDEVDEAATNLPNDHMLYAKRNVVDDDDNDDDDDDGDLDELQPTTPDSISDQAASAQESDIMPDLLVELQSSDSSNCSKLLSMNSSELENELLSNELPALPLVGATTDYNSSGNELFSPDSDVYSQNFYDCLSTNIFDTQFLTVGVGQRAWRCPPNVNEAMRNVRPPPGFEHTLFYGRLRTNRMGVPLGGIAFDVSPANARQGSNDPNHSGFMDGAYGLAGLAANLEAAQKNPQLFSHIFGHDAAGLNVAAHCCASEANKMHSSFAGPLQGGRCAPHEVNHDVPLYYRRAGGQELPQPKVDQMEVELLFFFFYTYPGDMMQMLAAAELAERGWRFHIYERLWIRRQVDNPNYRICGYQESGEYNYFNMVHWKILARHFDLLPEQLERTITKAELREQYGYHPQMSFF